MRWEPAASVWCCSAWAPTGIRLRCFRTPPPWKRTSASSRAAGRLPRPITLTFPALAAADQLLFLVAGADKAETIETLAQRPEVFPAGRARSERGTTTWLVDADAAARLQP